MHVVTTQFLAWVDLHIVNLLHSSNTDLHSTGLYFSAHTRLHSASLICSFPGMCSADHSCVDACAMSSIEEKYFVGRPIGHGGLGQVLFAQRRRDRQTLVTKLISQYNVRHLHTV